MRRCPAAPPARLTRALVIAAMALAGCAGADDRPRMVAVATHTVEDAGLLEVLDSAFRAAHPELRLRLVVTGTGEALEIGRRGDADVLLTHAPEDEQRFVAEGHGVERRPVMHNDFLIAGPAADPARVRGAGDAVLAFRAIRNAGAPFVSRADEGGTHKRERALWAALGAAPDWDGYTEAGLGMADALRVAAQRGAYILTDRATFATLGPDAGLVALVEGDPRLVNPYAVTLVAGAANPEGARAFADWLVGAEAERLIRAFGRDRAGRPLFVPGAPGAPGAADTPRAPGAPDAAPPPAG
ncbi:MAG: substrate-binding domain-containing protein [Gemmatimonadota bacterium]